MKVPGQKLTENLAKSLLRDKRRMKQCIRYWCSQERFFKEEDFIYSFVHHMLHDPIQLHIEMNSITLFPNYSIPLRMLTKKELSCIHALLRLNHSQEMPIFRSKVGLKVFQLKYDQFKYNAVLSQRTDRLGFIKCFIQYCETQITFNEHLETLQRIIHNICTTIADSYGLKGHPLQKGMYRMVQKKTCPRRSKLK